MSVSSNKAFATLFCAGLATMSSSACAQGAQPPASIAVCAAIESAVARLDCFDELARSTAATRSESDTPVPQRGPDEAPRESNEPPTAHGEPAALDEDLSRREQRRAARVAREIIAEVAALREIQPGRLEITLTNGQVWRQRNSDSYHLQPGHEVRIYPSGYGQHFRLSATELRSFIQVERVQ
jgi:hypothetical protein